MSANPLYPAFIRVNWHTPFAPHVMTLPTRAWNPATLTTDSGQYSAWDGSAVDAQVMLFALLDKIKVLYNADTGWDRYEIWTRATPTSDAQLRHAAACTQVGAGGNVGWSEAVQKTYSLKDTNFNIAKFVLLDAFTDNAFAKYYTVSTDEASMLHELTGSFNAWSSRAGYKPQTLRSLTIALNERLRREYHLR